MTIPENLLEEKRRVLHQLISERVLMRNYSNDPLEKQGTNWIFDFRRIVLHPEYLNLITALLWEKIKDYDALQIGGLETASIPLITSLILEAQKEGKKINGFYIRKSRKKQGLYKHVEGELNDDPIVLVDDLMNSATSIGKQLEVLDELGKKVDRVLTIIRFRELTEYPQLQNRNIKIESIFTLKDFDVALNEQINFKSNPFTRKLLFRPTVAAYQHVVQKSTPVLVEDTLYYGTDEGLFLALDSQTGLKKWQYKTSHSMGGKKIFSSPAIHEDMVIFGAYDGNLYALDRFYGSIKWVFSEADMVGSSPAVAREIGLVFVGLEFGLPGSRGATVALEIATGKKVWEYTSSAYTHASPLYIQKYQMVCNGGNEGVLRAFEAKTGRLLWQLETEGGSSYDGVSGFSGGDIKLAPVYDEETDQIAFSSMDGWMYVVRRDTGALQFRVCTDYHDTVHRSGVYGSPLFTKKFVLFAGLDKRLYCYDKKTGKLVWQYATNGRIFATPVEIGSSIFVGSNDGCLYEIATETGEVVSKTQFSERITNPIVYEKSTGLIYVTTHVNEVYTLQRPLK